MKNVALILAGCGKADGNDPMEVNSLLLAMAQAGHRVRCYAPDRPQIEVVDHLSRRPMQDLRNIRVESARLVAQPVQDLDDLLTDSCDAILLPGGAGVLRNLSSFALRGQHARLAPDLESVLLNALAGNKPVLAMGAAVLLLGLASRAAGLSAVRLSVGNEEQAPELALALEGWGAKLSQADIDEACIDSQHRLISVPASLYARAGITDLFGAGLAAGAALSWLLSETDGLA